MDENKLVALPTSPLSIDFGTVGERGWWEIGNKFREESLNSDSVTGEKEYEKTAIVAFTVPETVKKEVDNLAAELGGKPVDPLHITLVFLGELADLDQSVIRESVKNFAVDWQPINGVYNGLAVFHKGDRDENDGKTPVVMLYDSPELADFRHHLLESLDGLIIDQNHGFTPHTTICYLDTDEIVLPVIQKPIPASFDRLALLWGTECEYFQLGGKTEKGGAGSGNFGHAGRPGKVGGSAEAGGAAAGVFPGERIPESAYAGSLFGLEKYTIPVKNLTTEQIRKKVLSLPGLVSDEEIDGMKARLSELSDIVNNPSHETREKILAMSVEEKQAYFKRVFEESEPLGKKLKAALNQNLHTMSEFMKAENPLSIKVIFTKENKSEFGPRDPEEGEIEEVKDYIQSVANTIQAKANKPADVRIRLMNLFGASFFDEEDTANGAIHLGGEASWDDNSGETAIHEFGHWMDFNDGRIGKRTLKFLEKRIDEDKEGIREQRYSNGQINFRYVKDHFIDKYMGRLYFNRNDELSSSEILSTGVSMYFTNPHKLAKGDPEMFDYVTQTLRGNYK